MNLILIGMKHCGKSTLGAKLAQRWNCAFYDVDQRIEENYACQTAVPRKVREIFTEDGEEEFHKAETQVVCELAMKLERSSERHVVAVGGRTVLNETNRRLLGDLGQMVYLQVDPRELYRRIARSGLPPFLNPSDPEGDFLRLCREREPQYLQIADLVVNLDGMDIEQALDTLIERLNEM